MRRHRWEIGIVLLLLIGTAAVFAPALRQEFVAWDDDTLLYENPHLTGLNAATIHWAFTGFDYVVRYQPLTWLTWAGIYQCAGRNPFGYHLASLLAHCLNTILVFVLLRNLLAASPGTDTEPARKQGRLLFAGAGALLWAVHPLRVETVAWASAFLHSQAIFFLLLSALAYLGAAQAPESIRRRALYWGAVAAYAASLFSYPIGLGFVVALVALDVYPLQRFGVGAGRWWNASARRLWLEKLPFAAAAIVCVGITLWARLHVRAGWIEAAPLSEFGVAHRIMQACYVWAYYVWKPWMPLDLSPVYTALLDFRPAEPAFVQSAVFLGIVSVILFAQRREWPAALPLWMSYLALMVPVLGLSEHPHYANDRYGNLAGILWSIAIAAALFKWCARPPRRAWAALAATIVVAAGLGTLSVRQVGIWRNSTTLFEHVLAKLGSHPYRFDIHWRLGRVLADEGQFDESIAHHLAALSIAPDFAEAHFGMGVALERKGQLDEAMQRYATAIQLKPDYAEAHARLGLLLAARGRRVESLAHLRHALRVDSSNPKLADARKKLAELEALAP